jgi:hydroxymethylglutaryl-CoA reductase (NADPH)
MIGYTAVPVGIAGPLLISGDKSYYLPLATTEGALVASVNRGCKAITQSGGVRIKSERVGISRAPVFVVEGITQGYTFMEWVKKQKKQFAVIAQTTSRHIQLVQVQTWMEGKNVFVRFSFDTSDAMGMNMATIAVSEIIQCIEKETKVKCIALSGNMCVDKKPNFLNFIEGRGQKVWADIILPDTILESVLKSSASEIYDVAQRKLSAGSLMAGTIGTNAHSANVLAAMFLATGQDIAHVAECSMGVTSVEKEKKGLYVSVYFPDMVVGTVGGGTTLATQQEALHLLHLAGGNEGKNSQKLAEIMASACLAGEISLLASLAQGSLSTAHKTLGRGMKQL